MQVVGIIWCVAFILGGALAASAFILAKKPDAKAIMDKIAPYQGIIGIVLFGLGAYWLIMTILHIGELSAAPVWLVRALAGTLVSVALGILLAFALLSQYLLGGSEEAKKKADDLRAMLVTYQIPLGFVGIGLGIWNLIGYIG